MNRNNKAFTLAEFMLTIVIMGVIGLSIAGVSRALSSCYAQSETIYADSQVTRSAMTQVQAVLRRAKLVTAASGTALVVWLQDTNGDGKIQTNELMYIMLDSSTKQVKQCQAVYPQSITPSTLLLQNLTTISSASQVVTADPYKQWTTLATEVNSFKVAVDHAAPLSTLITIQMSVGSGTSVCTARGAVCLRADATDQVVKSNNQYSLDALVLP